MFTTYKLYTRVKSFLYECGSDAHLPSDFQSLNFRDEVHLCMQAVQTANNIQTDASPTFFNSLCFQLGNTVLFEAAFYDDEVVVQWLIDRGININDRNQCGWTALHHACYWGRENSCKELILAGAKLDIKTNVRILRLTSCLLNLAD